MKRVLAYIFGVVLFGYLIFVLNFAAAKIREVACQGIRVNVTNRADVAFVDEEEIRKLIASGYGEIFGAPVTAVNKDSLEKLLVRHPMIQSAQVYYRLDGFFQVNITQRMPVLRVMAGEGYYVDDAMNPMPLSSRFSARVPVVTGAVNREFACRTVAPFAVAISRSPFWDAYIEQIVVYGSHQVALIPKVGDFRITLGSLEGWPEKLEKMRLFLEQGIAQGGWDRYKEIKLQYADQVVCVKK